MLGFDEEQFMCGACRMVCAGDALDDGHCERDTGFDPALLQHEKFIDERWRKSLTALAQYRRIPLVEDNGLLGFENPVPQTTVEAGDGDVLGQRPTAKRQNARQNAEGEEATEGTEDEDPATDGADGAGEQGAGERRERRKLKKKQKKARDAQREGEAVQGGGEANRQELLQQAEDAEMGAEAGQGQGEGAEEGF